MTVTVENARMEVEYLTEVAEFWATRDHEECTSLQLCSACHEFFGDIDAASLAYDLAVSAAHPARRTAAWIGGGA